MEHPSYLHNPKEGFVLTILAGIIEIILLLKKFFQHFFANSLQLVLGPKFSDSHKVYR
jgi:hypothetical protein